MDTKSIIQIIAASAIPLSIALIIVQRICSDRGIGVRIIQFLALIILPIVVLILGLERIVDGSTIGAIIAGLAGYLFANIGRFDEQKGTKNQSTDI